MEIGSASVEVLHSDITRVNYLKLGVDTIVLTHPDGTKAAPVLRDYIKCRDAVAVLICAAKDHMILLLQQYRHPVYVATSDIKRAYIYEAVAGCRDGDEDPLLTAQREVKEETGLDLELHQIRHIRTVFPSPGISTERIHLYIATVDSVQAPTANGLANEGERTMPVWLSRQKVKKMVTEQTIEDAKTLLLLAGKVNWL